MGILQLHLYDAIAATGTLEYSTTSDTGPWTALPLSGPMAVLDALAFWTGAIVLVVPEFDLSYNVGTNQIESSCATLVWLQLSPTLADLLGFSDTVLLVEDGSPIASDLTPLGIVSLEAHGRSLPVDVETAELDEVRAGRATTYHHGRAVEVRLDFSIAPDLWDDLEGTTLMGGHARCRVTDDNADPYGEDDLDGALDVDPLETVSVQQASPYDHALVTWRASMEDPP